MARKREIAAVNNCHLFLKGEFMALKQKIAAFIFLKVISKFLKVFFFPPRLFQASTQHSTEGFLGKEILVTVPGLRETVRQATCGSGHQRLSAALSPIWEAIPACQASSTEGFLYCHPCLWKVGRELKGRREAERGRKGRDASGIHSCFSSNLLNLLIFFLQDHLYYIHDTL